MGRSFLLPFLLIDYITKIDVCIYKKQTAQNIHEEKQFYVKPEQEILDSLNEDVGIQRRNNNERNNLMRNGQSNGEPNENDNRPIQGEEQGDGRGRAENDSLSNERGVNHSE